MSRKNRKRSKVSGMTFAEGSQAWLKHMKDRIKPSSYANYTYLIHRHIDPFFGNMKLSAITRRELSAFTDEKLRCGRLKRKGGISGKYLKDMVSVIKSVAAYAEQEFDIPSRIRYAGSIRVEKKEVALPDRNERASLCRQLVSDGGLYAAGVLIAIYTGMRIGEVCGLRWDDVDLARGIIYVRRTVQRISDNNGRTAIVIGTPKTAHSARIIPIAPGLLRCLKRLAGSRGCYIVSGCSVPNEPARLRKRFLAFLHECGLPHMRFHVLRHLFASSCIEQRFDISAVSEMLGHSSKSMTLNVYAHSSTETKKKYMHRFRI